MSLYPLSQKVFAKLASIRAMPCGKGKGCARQHGSSGAQSNSTSGVWNWAEQDGQEMETKGKCAEPRLKCSMHEEKIKYKKKSEINKRA